MTAKLITFFKNYSAKCPEDWITEGALMTEDETIHAICGGDYDHWEISKIIEIDLDAMTIKDVTSHIAMEVCAHTFTSRYEPNYKVLTDFLTKHGFTDWYREPVLRYRGSRSDPYHWVAE